MTLSAQQFDSAFAAFERAVLTAGTQSEFARAIGCTPANIHQLLKGRRLLPSRFVLSAEAATGVSRHELRPDIYPPDLYPAPGAVPAAPAPGVLADEAGAGSVSDSAAADLAAIDGGVAA